jgi:hypothetical protein
MTTEVISYLEDDSALLMGNKSLSKFSYYQHIDKVESDYSDNFIHIKIEKRDVDYFYNQSRFIFQLHELRENYCITAIQNLRKKNEFLQLSLDFAESSITEEEFESEVENNPEKYVIDLKELDNFNHLPVISSILEKVGGEFNSGDVSDLFSIDIRSLNKHLKLLNSK